MYKFFIFYLFFTFCNSVFAEEDIDQWKISEKTYMDLIEEGFEVKSYDTTVINSDGGLTILLFITVLQKNRIVFECQEYQTLDSVMRTIDMSLVCKELTQPYRRGTDT